MMMISVTASFVVFSAVATVGSENSLGFDVNSVRFAVFLGLLLTFLAAEALMPKRLRQYTRVRRWLTNLGNGGLSMLLMRGLAQLTVPIAAVAVAIACERSGIGLFAWLDWPLWLEVVLVMITLDLAVWFQHWASHHVPLLWRLHHVHHADPDFDTTTALRFHPIEIALSMLFKMVVVAVLGAPPIAVVLFEMVLNGTALFNHANLALPGWLDRVLRLVIVTPDMHRIHHSSERREHDTNFGFNLPWWDRLFGTYTADPVGGQHGMTIGLPHLQTAEPTRLTWLLMAPFRRTK
jgi:sterol desaturase/sphingolipid hydroxylase (fatty acid hydroxylase superfamily)